jgi:predicted nucleic acid-binding protein
MASTLLTDPAVPLIADTSAIINLNSTGHAPEIVRAIPSKVVVVDTVSTELDDGRERGRQDADLLNSLVAAGLIEIVKLNDSCAIHFEKLVVGPASMTLDDGEAATIAYAFVHEGIAIIDERKATRICGEMFPELRICSTVDILAHPDVWRSLGKQLLAEAVLNALRNGRMRVLPHHIEWVVDLIGPEHAAACPSLPKAARKPQENVAAVRRTRGK